MRSAAWGAASCLLALAATTVADPPKAPAAPDAAAVVAAESLWHSARSLRHQPQSPPSTPGRRLALLLTARQLDRTNPHVARDLMALYEQQGQFAPAARLAEQCILNWPGDAELLRRWLGQRLAVLQDAAGRERLLLAVRDKTDYPPVVRAAAAVEYAALLRGQGRHEQARLQYEAVLREWDPLHPRALRGQLELSPAPGYVDVVAVKLKLLQGNPGAVDEAWRLALLLDELGLHDPAVSLFEFVWQVADGKQAAEEVSGEFLAQYCNALLSAGRAERAITRFAPLTRKYPQSLDLRALLAEAYQMTGRDDLAAAQVAAMAAINKPKEATAAESVAFAKDLAAFHLLSRPDAARALAFARLAAASQPGDLVAQRLLGAAEVRSGQADQVRVGAERLRRLVDRDLYAAVFLAEHQFQTGQGSAGKQTVLRGLARGGAGPAHRRLLALAKKHKITPPAPPGRDQVATFLARGADQWGPLDGTVPAGFFQQALHPEKHLTVTLQGPAGPLLPGQPVPLTARLTNTSSARIRLGDWGLLNPRLDVSVLADGDRKAQFRHLVLLRWPAPRYLAPGQSVRQTVRIDLGPLATFLDRYPFAELTLTVAGLLDPVQSGAGFQSWLPTVPVHPVRVVRSGLLGPLDPSRPARAAAGYEKLLLDLTRHIKHGTATERMWAARRVGAVLGVARNVELKRRPAPTALEKVLAKPMLLSMTRALLADRAEAVRAEMLAALDGVALDEPTLAVLSPAVEDSHFLVRLRMVELLGATGSPVHRTVLDYLAQDPHELVRKMASAFADQPDRR